MRGETSSDKAMRLKLWVEKAQHAIAQGQGVNDFVMHCHWDNRRIAVKAYKLAVKQRESDHVNTHSFPSTF